ncbi:hypothetical protein [Calothrix sp. PCC 7507]|uniref:hypothetical protein n=1 Tax=Calothrix sp. PCC 7507 TaxID=99598 RepID=UPI00029F2ACB|nr:hypothetical protein [Calothrix sp. PCC 7507]AFY33985.1 hypothetical protein Cal7507_3593 [Calothrix sp. PCC 7507]
MTNEFNDVAMVKTCSLGRIIYISALLIMLWGCAASGFNTSGVTWKTYNNSRYSFEFPYPSNWASLPAPDNDDGITFVSPQKNSVQIRSWAGNRLPESLTKNRDVKTTIDPNFRTVQGVSGVLVVDVDPQVSLMTLTLTQGQIKYYWQGRSQTQEFPDYYNLFYYIAQQYRIPK